MTSLAGWNARWYQPGESLWSAANKLAFVACAPVGDVLRLLAGPGERSPEWWLFPSGDRAVQVCELLKLPLAAAKGQLFASVGSLPSLDERENWQLGIRHCRGCLGGYVHRTVFQDRRTRKCPVHGTTLLEGCPVCKAPLGPGCDEPWSCAFCGTALAMPGRGWLRQFSAGPVLRALPDTSGSESRVPPLHMPDNLMRQWVAQVAYEEHSAIWSTLLGRHVVCAQRDMDALNAAEMPCRFSCPLAAAVWQSAKLMGIRPEFSPGPWTPKKPGFGAGLTNAAFLLAEVPPERVDDAVRALVRQWTLELLEAVTDAAEAGQTVARWSGASFRLAPADSKIYDRLTDLAARASARCRMAELSAFHNVAREY